MKMLCETLMNEIGNTCPDSARAGCHDNSLIESILETKQELREKQDGILAEFTVALEMEEEESKRTGRRPGQ